MKHIVQFSGGKDSTCMLLMMLERGMQVDEIIFCDTGMEFPQMYGHIDKVEKYIGERYGKRITTLKAKHDYLWYMNEKPRKDGGKGWGWASMVNRWCTAELKTRVQKSYSKQNEPYTSYIGIALDEPKRHQNIPASIRHPLFEWGITEKQALEYCKSHGFDWDGLYEKFRRVSCWCCPLKGIGEYRILYHEFPALWEKLKKMDERAWNQFRRDYSVIALEEKFKKEDRVKGMAIGLWDE